jgi:hypothetical protein
MLHFTLRDMLWLTVVVGLLLVMWRDRAKIISERALLQNEHKAVKAKQRELDTQFIRLVNQTEELHKLVQENARP